VARLAGIPANVTSRAREILKKHEENEHQLSDNLTVRAKRKTRVIVDQLPLLDIDNLTPVEALRHLADLRKRANEGS
jgi:DNA mismatch repair ATPase MutS